MKRTWTVEQCINIMALAHAIDEAFGSASVGSTPSLSAPRPNIQHRKWQPVTTLPALGLYNDIDVSCNRVLSADHSVGQLHARAASLSMYVIWPRAAHVRNH